MIVMRVGPAVGVLLAGAAPDGADHDRLATEALRAVTGLRDLTVARRPSGRPKLMPPYRELAVSLSYRGGLLLAGYGGLHDLGADIEPADGLGGSDPYRMAADHFAPEEAAAVQGLNSPAALDLFLRLWVAKEAALKITGRGIYDGLDEPNLAGQLAALAMDGKAIRLPPSVRLPALELAVWRTALPSCETWCFCGLAYAL